MTIKSIFIRIFALVCIPCVGVLSVGTATAATWQYPGEISVAQVYNDIFFTHYDTTTTDGLANLVADHGTAMQGQWDVSSAAKVTVVVMDTSGTSPVGIMVGDTVLPFYTPGSWTAPSRGYINDPVNGTDWAAGVVDIAAFLTAHGYAADSPFSFVVGSAPMDSSNTYRLDNNNTNGGFLLAYNEGGLTGGDGDANEPVLYVNPPLSEPGSCDGRRPTVIGTAGRDVLTASNFDNSGDDVIMTFAGNDVIYAGPGNDIVCAGDGNDVVYGEGGDDTLFGGDGNDVVYAGDGNDTVSGGAGTDRLFGGNGDDVIHGDAGDDTIKGEAGNDQLFGDDGNDTILGGDGVDTISGGAGDDTLEGGGADVIHGDDGNDKVVGNGDASVPVDGDNQLFGDAGDDLVVGDTGNDLLDGGPGNDKLVGYGGNDTLQGDDGDDSLYGGDGDDAVDGGAGTDVCDGGSGSDTELNCETATNF